MWVGGDERDIHFNSPSIGQGAASALPVWALYMRRVYADKRFGKDSNREFEKPEAIDDHNKAGVSTINGSDNQNEGETEEHSSEGEKPVETSKPKSSGENYFE